MDLYSTVLLHIALVTNMVVSFVHDLHWYFNINYYDTSQYIVYEWVPIHLFIVPFVLDVGLVHLNMFIIQWMNGECNALTKLHDIFTIR